MLQDRPHLDLEHHVAHVLELRFLQGIGAEPDQQVEALVAQDLQAGPRRRGLFLEHLEVTVQHAAHRIDVRAERDDDPRPPRRL